jgi:type I restriction enzyme S subunit
VAVWSTVRLSELSTDLRIDAEYYRPDVLALRRAVSDGPWPVETIDQLSDSVINFGKYSLCNDIMFQEFESRDADAVEFVTAQDIQDGFIDHANARWISSQQHNGLLWKSRVQKGQVLVAMAARLGHAAVFDRDTPLNSSQDVAKISVRDTREIDPYYLAIYVNSAVGRGLLESSQTGSVQQHTNLGRIKSIPVVKLPRRVQLDVAKLYREAVAARQKSYSSIDTAERQLTEALGLGHFDLEPQRSYSRPFRDLRDDARFDAEFYMPCKWRVLGALAALPHRPLSFHVRHVRDLWNPESSAGHLKVRNFDLGDALEPFLDDTKEAITADEVGSTKKRFDAGDVVISRLRSYLREIAVVRTSSSIQSVGSSEFIVLRPTGEGLSAAAIFVYLRSLLIQTVLKWSQDGSNHPRFDEGLLLTLPVPDRLMDVSSGIERHVHAAIEARQEAASLMLRAKKVIEDMISGAGPRD